jgi:hypothetical protein
MINTKFNSKNTKWMECVSTVFIETHILLMTKIQIKLNIVVLAITVQYFQRIYISSIHNHSLLKTRNSSNLSISHEIIILMMS